MSSINYDLKKIKGIAFDVDGVLSPSTIPLSPEGEPLRMVSIKDGYALQLAVKKGLKIAIITGGNTKAVDVRFRGLGIDDVFLGSSMKLPILQQWMDDNGLSADEVAFVGDDIPDYQVMRRCGCPCCPADACSDIQEISTYVSRCKGGYGVGRDIIEQELRAQGKWLSDSKAFGW
mgnify:CR=1 FL=1